jgi:ribosomal protein S21
MVFSTVASVARRAMTSALAGTSKTAPSAIAAPFALASASALANARQPSLATRPMITIPVERGDAERAYKRLRRIMMSEGIYKDLRASTEGHRKPSQLRVLARKERERRTKRSKLNSKLGWIMRQKERGF